jgi:hypothetical protein
MLRERAPTPPRVHGAENLDIADGIKAEPARDPGFHKLDDAGDRGLGIIRLDKIEIALSFTPGVLPVPRCRAMCGQAMPMPH